MIGLHKLLITHKSSLNVGVMEEMRVNQTQITGGNRFPGFHIVRPQ